MARLGLLLLLNLLGLNNAWACYCTSPWMATLDGRQYCIANAECWACVPGAYDPNWQSLFCGNYVPPAPPPPPPPTCQTSTESQTGTCPANTTGTVTITRQSTCPDPYGVPVWGQWQTQSDCTPNSPTCQTSTEAKTESCQSGYIGQKDYTRQSVCPDPYGAPVWGDWNLIGDSCTKSVTNPTNPLSPISPVSPMSAPAMPVAPVTVPTPAPMTTPETQTDSPSETAPQSAPSESAPSGAPSAVSPAPAPTAGTGARAAAMVQRLTMIGALPPQPTIIETLTLSQQMPDDIKKQQDFVLELFTIGGAFEGLEGVQNQTFQQIINSNTIQGSGYE